MPRLCSVCSVPTIDITNFNVNTRINYFYNDKEQLLPIMIRITQIAWLMHWWLNSFQPPVPERILLQSRLRHER